MGVISKVESLAEWLSWSETMNVLSSADVRYPWRVLPSWCAQGRVHAKAATLVNNEGVAEDFEFTPELWKMLGEYNIKPDSMKGSITARFTYEDGEDLHTWLGLQFKSCDLLSLLPHMTDADIAEALAKSPWMSGSRKQEPEKAEPQPKALPFRTGGSSGKVEVWHKFYIEAMKMLNDGEMDGIKTQAELQRTLLSRIDEAMSEKPVKQAVSRIWYQVLDKD